VHPLIRPGISLAAGALILVALWLAGDALHAYRIRTRSASPSARRARGEPFRLCPEGSPALLCIHGFADSPAVFARIAPVLAEAGLAVRAPRLSGSGRPPRDMAGITLADWRADIDRELAALRREAPNRPVWLAGHSLGGALAFDAALRADPPVAGLVLLAPLVEPSRARSPVLSPRGWFGLLDRLLVFSSAVESRLPPDIRDPAARAAYSTDKFIHRDIYRALFAAIDAVRPRAGDWTGPLFMAVSPSDRIVDSAAAERFFRDAVHAAPARLVRQEKAGHVLPLDNGHGQLAADIAAFIRSTTP